MSKWGLLPNDLTTCILRSEPLAYLNHTDKGSLSCLGPGTSSSLCACTYLAGFIPTLVPGGPNRVFSLHQCTSAVTTAQETHQKYLKPEYLTTLGKKKKKASGISQLFNNIAKSQTLDLSIKISSSSIHLVYTLREWKATLIQCTFLL